MARLIFFDVETRKLAKELNIEDEEQGWEDLRHGGGGISAMVLYDSFEDWTYLYDDREIVAAAQHLEMGDSVIGYRSERFDIPCIEGILDRNLRLRNHFDIYALIARTNAHRGIIGTKGDFTLDAVCRRNLGRGKTGSGAHAPTLAREGRWAELFRYCMSDVRLTRDLFRYICEHDGCINNNGTFLPLTIPDWIKRSTVKE